MDLMQDLQRQGWYLTENGIKDCCGENKAKLDDVIRAAMDMDLKDIGEKHLPESLGKAKTEFVDGPFVLQIQKVRNVAVPKESDNQDGGGGQKLLRLSLTDGQGTCTAVDMNGISGLSHNTPPGSKIKLSGRVPVNQGFLLLNKSNCKLLGGRVEKLVESWELKRALAMQNRASVTQEGRPPPFIPFGQRRNDAQPVSNKRDNFRSLEAVAKKKELDCEFEQQRKAIIEAALQEGRAKSFASASKQTLAQDKNVAAIIEMGFTVDQANLALRKMNGNLEDAVTSLLGDGDARSNNVASHYPNDNRHSGSQGRRPPSLLTLDQPERPGGRRRGGKPDETEDYEQHTKPSAPATLFDFVTSKIPSKSDKAASKSHHSLPDSSRDREKPRHQSPDDASKTNNKSRQKSPEDSTVMAKPRPPSPEDSSRGRTSPDEAVPDKHQNSLSSSSAGQSAGHGGGSSNHHNPVQNLPPRLQKKQLREEEEKMYKFHGKDSSAISDWTRDRMSHKVYDVNSRGPVSHKSLWSDEKDARDRNHDGGRTTAPKGKPGDGKSGDGDKNYQRSAKDAYQMHGNQQLLQQQQQQQPMHMMNTVKPLMECTPCSVQPLMQCTTDGVQLIQSMAALQLYPATSIQVAQAPAYLHGGHTTTTTAMPSAVRDGVANNVPKENISWKMGDICLAKWVDKQFYRAKILQTEQHFAFVSFIDYGNDADKVPYADLRPMVPTTRDTNTNVLYSSSIPPGTSIIYPEHGASVMYPSHNGHYSAVPVCTAGAPPSGFLVQGPGAFPSYATDHPYRIVTNSGRAGGGLKSSKRPSIEKPLYVPPAQRK